MTSPKIAHDTTSVRHIVAFTVEGAEPVTPPYGVQSFAPDAARVTIQDGRIVSVKVSGPRLLAGGRTGAQQLTADYFEHQLSRIGKTPTPKPAPNWDGQAPAPDWVIDLASRALVLALAPEQAEAQK